MIVDVNTQERRRETRRPISLPALIKIGTNLYGKGFIKEISLSGARIESISIFKIIRPARLAELSGMPVSIHTNIPFSLSLQGTVKHIEPACSEAGIYISATTDKTLWKKLAEGYIEP